HTAEQLSVWQGSPAWLARYFSSAVTCCSMATSEQVLPFTKAWTESSAKHLLHVCSPVVCSARPRLAYASSASGMLARTSRREVRYSVASFSTHSQPCWSWAAQFTRCGCRVD